MMNPFKFLYDAIKSLIQSAHSTTMSDVSSHTNSVLPVIPQNDLIVAMGNEEDTTVERVTKAPNFVIFIASHELFKRFGDFETFIDLFEFFEKFGEFLEGLYILMKCWKEFLWLGEWLWGGDGILADFMNRTEERAMWINERAMWINGPCSVFCVLRDVWELGKWWLNRKSLVVPSVELIKELGEKIQGLFDAVEFIQWLDLGLISSYLESIGEWSEWLKGLFALLQLCINIWKLVKWLSLARKGVNWCWGNLDMKDCGESLEGISEAAVFLGGGKKLGEEWLGVGDMSKALDIVEKWGEFFKSVCSVGEFLVDDFWKKIQASPDPSPVPDFFSCPEPYPEPYHGPSRAHPDIC